VENRGTKAGYFPGLSQARKDRPLVAEIRKSVSRRDRENKTQQRSQRPDVKSHYYLGKQKAGPRCWTNLIFFFLKTSVM
jgi:hypothetical protein